MPASSFCTQGNGNRGPQKTATAFSGGPGVPSKSIGNGFIFLYNSNASDSANKICNIYGSRGYEFLRDIYEKHNKYL